MDIIISIWTLVQPLLITIGVPLLIAVVGWIAISVAFAYTYDRLRLWVFLVIHVIEAYVILLLTGVRIPGFLTSWTATKEALFWPLMLALGLVIFAFFECAVFGLKVDDNDELVPYPKRGKNWWGKRIRELPPLNVAARGVIYWIFLTFVIVQISAYGFMSSWPLVGKIIFWMASGACLGLLDGKLMLLDRLERRLARVLDPLLFGFVLTTESKLAQPRPPFGGAEEAGVDDIREAGLL